MEDNWHDDGPRGGYLTDVAVALVEQAGAASVGATLVVDGLVVTGFIVSIAEYNEALHRGVHERLLGRGLPPEKLDRLELEAAAMRDAISDQDSFPFVHIREAVLGSGSHRTRVPDLRVLASRVSAFAMTGREPDEIDLRYSSR